MNKLKIAVIGMGKMGRTRYEAMQRHGGFKVVSICDTVVENLIDYDVEQFTEWQTCIDQSDIDAVMVCTYNAFIPEIVCYALNKGLKVFSEKPPGRNLADTMRMKEALDKSGGILKFGFNHRYHNSVIEAKALLNSGCIGEIVCARGVYGKAGAPNFGSEWRNNPGLSGGGILLDQGIHMLDLLCYFLGDFSKVKSSISNLVWNEMLTEDSAFAILETENGRIASLHSSAVQWKHKFDLDLICSNGYIALNGILTSTKSYGRETMTYYLKDLQARTGLLGKPLEHTLLFDQDESWDLEVREFYDVVVNGAELKQGTIDQAINVMTLIEKIYQHGMEK